MYDTIRKEGLSFPSAREPVYLRYDRHDVQYHMITVCNIRYVSELEDARKDKQKKTSRARDFPGRSGGATPGPGFDVLPGSQGTEGSIKILLRLWPFAFHACHAFFLYAIEKIHDIREKNMGRKFLPADRNASLSIYLKKEKIVYLYICVACNAIYSEVVHR